MSSPPFNHSWAIFPSRPHSHVPIWSKFVFPQFGTLSWVAVVPLSMDLATNRIMVTIPSWPISYLPTRCLRKMGMFFGEVDTTLCLNWPISHAETCLFAISVSYQALSWASTSQTSALSAESPLLIYCWKHHPCLCQVQSWLLQCSPSLPPTHPAL